MEMTKEKAIELAELLSQVIAEPSGSDLPVRDSTILHTAATILQYAECGHIKPDEQGMWYTVDWPEMFGSLIFEDLGFE